MFAVTKVSELNDPRTVMTTNEAMEILESQLHKWQETMEDYYVRISEELHALRLLCRSRKGKKENPEDQSLNDKQLVETEVATEPISQLQVHVSKLEPSPRFHNASPTVGEDSQYVVGRDGLCDHQKSILQVSNVKARDELLTKSTNGNGEKVAHQVFDKMTLRVQSKRRQIKSPKSWKFKFKVSSEDTDFVVKMDQWCILGQLWLDHRNQTGCVPIEEALFMETDADYVQQDEFEQVVNHTPFSVVKFGKYKACDALLLLLPSDERFQVKHKWRFRLSHSLSEMKQRMIGRVWKSFGYLMEDMMEEDQKLQGDSEPLLTAPDFAAKICETFDHYIRKKGFVSADRESESNQPTLRFSKWVIEILLNHYMVLLLTPVAYAIHFMGGVGMDKKQSLMSLWINRVWDPGRSLVKDTSYSTRIFSSLPATLPVSLLCQESFAYQITSFSTNLEVKVSLKGKI